MGSSGHPLGCETDIVLDLGERSRQRREEEERDRGNAQHAGLAYEVPNPEDLDQNQDVSGLPWGSLSLKHVVETGKAKEERESREGSTTPAVQGRGPTQ